MFKRINTELNDVPSKAIFDHLRNYFMCAFLLAIGTFEFRAQTNSFFGLIQSQYSGAGVIGLSCVLIGLNFYSGIRSISKSKYHLIFTLGLVLIYIFFTIRVIEMAWNFRITAWIWFLKTALTTLERNDDGPKVDVFIIILKKTA